MLLPILEVAIFAVTCVAAPQALVYRGPAACDGCPEAVAQLLRTSPSKFNVTYAGPHEDVDITKEMLSRMDAYAQAGGGGLSETWPEMKPYSDIIREYVSNGGKYLGFCLGTYLAGTPGFDILPPHDNTNEECIQAGAEVQNRSNTIIQVDWHFSTGSLADETQKRWVFFQDGAVLKLPNKENVQILGRYSSNGDVAGSLSPFGKGWVGVVGPHPEADRSWYTPYNLENPDGINFDVGYDFIETTMQSSSGAQTASESVASTSSIILYGHNGLLALVLLMCVHIALLETTTYR